MNDLWIIAGGNGLQDGLNPCIFMACAVFIVHGLWLKRNSLGTLWPRIIFTLAYASGLLAFNFGPAQIFIFQKKIIFATKVLYFVLGCVAFVLGIVFFKDWVLSKRGLPVKEDADELPKRSAANAKAVFLVTAALGLVLSALAAIWPINNYIMLLGNESLLKGQWQLVTPLLAGYVLTSMWPLWFVWAFLKIKGRPALLKIFCAAVFFTASSCVIFIFK